jgi:hypothetical protein
MGPRDVRQRDRAPSQEQGRPAVDDILQDVRYAFRQHRKAPLFTLTATISLALGIGANAGVFTVIERALLRPLPVANPHELVYVSDERILTQPSPRFSYPFYTILRDNNVLAGVTARAGGAMNATVDGQMVRVTFELVSGSYFGVLGATNRDGAAALAGGRPKPRRASGGGDQPSFLAADVRGRSLRHRTAH